MNFVSTMNRDVFNRYGYRLLDSFEKFSAAEDHLYIYTEDRHLSVVVKGCLCYARCTVVNFHDERIIKFLRKFRNSRKFRGGRSLFSIHSIRRLIRKMSGKKVVGSVSYDFLRDVYRFSFKPFAIWSFIDRTLNDGNGNLICYVDADCSFRTFFPNYEDVANLHSADIAYFGRETYTETGVMFFRPNIELKRFCERWVEMYFSETFAELGSWTDCHTFDHCRVNAEFDLRFADLNVIGESNHPIAKSALSPYLDHRKGDRKPLQLSPELAK